MSNEVTVGADRLVEALERLGVDVVFGLPGVHNLPVWSSLRSSSIRLVGVRHEQTAAYAADGYSRATGKLGVALVTTGPGAANTLGAIGEARASRSAALVIATEIPRRLARVGVYRGVLHETRDQQAMFVPVTKAQETVDDADEIGLAVMRLAAMSLSAPAGPVYLGVPTDLLSEPAAPLPSHDGDGHAPVAPSDQAIGEAATLIDAARRPLIWAGGGAVHADAGKEVAELATQIAAPVITTYMGRGLMPPDHPYIAPGPVHSPEIGQLWDDADLVIAIGSDFDGMMTQNWLMPPPRQMVAVNVDAVDANKNYPADVTVLADARTGVEALLDQVKPRTGGKELQAALSGLSGEINRAVQKDDPQAARFLAALDSALPADAVVVADMCIPGYWVAGYRRVPAPRKLAYPVGWGTLGFGFPASIGAALAQAGPAVCISGDGGFLFACGELATVAQEQVPLTIVLVDDGGYGMLRFDQQVAGDEAFGTDLEGPDFRAVSAAFSIPAVEVDGFGDDFETALRSAVQARAPRMVIANAHLKPPPTTSPRWYRKANPTAPVRPELERQA